MELRIPEMNIGVVGHVDHGKTTLVQALTGIWTARHSEELRRSMTIKLGYADGNIAFCESLGEPDGYTKDLVCPDGTEAKLLRRVSYVDAPGHEVLMATMLSGAALMDAALLVIAANEPCPQPQTREHLVALEIIGVKHVIVVQNKVDVVSPEEARRNYKQIVDFLSGTSYADAPVIPVSALHKTNIDVLLMAMHKLFPKPERDLSRPALMYVARSFDVNRPGTPPDRLVGGIVGGSILKGEIRIGDEVELKPGIRVVRGGRTVYEPITTKIVSIRYGEIESDVARPGGLAALGTTLDPSLTKGDALQGNVVGHNVPDPVYDLSIEYKLLERVVGTRELVRVEPIRMREIVMLTVGTAVTMGVVTRVTKERMDVRLKRPVVVLPGGKIAISRQIRGRWRLVGWGVPQNV
ncbi:MAG: translation initiation factor IF-2 subunit gamma [Thermoprotei archaeon]|nr:MAG: translation initiation factor IF-2 subunit gamma [Thermoprotei archaeon]